MDKRPFPQALLLMLVIMSTEYATGADDARV
jgi:hypothetical protein